MQSRPSACPVTFHHPAKSLITMGVFAAASSIQATSLFSSTHDTTKRFDGACPLFAESAHAYVSDHVKNVEKWTGADEVRLRRRGKSG
jgi:hypothetical protein